MTIKPRLTPVRLPVFYALPMPPSLNNAYPAGKNGRRYKSAALKKWIAEAGKELMCQGVNPIKGRVSIEIVMQEPKRPSDASNRIKAIEDLLVAHGIIAGDSNKCVRKVSAEWWEDWNYDLPVFVTIDHP